MCFVVTVVFLDFLIPKKVNEIFIYDCVPEGCLEVDVVECAVLYFQEPVIVQSQQVISYVMYLNVISLIPA